jgi:hypothetical protein
MLSSSNLVRSIFRRPVVVYGINAVASVRCKSTIGADPAEQQPVLPVYVHNVSRMVLEHLQENRSEWIMTNGLDGGLNINPNGTFIIKFPAMEGFDSGKIWYVKFFRSSFHCRFLFRRFGRRINALAVKHSSYFTVTVRTSYDSANKQHWLSVYRQKLSVRFLLKEYGPNAPRVHDASITQQQIAQAVDQMILAISQNEANRRQ